MRRFPCLLAELRNQSNREVGTPNRQYLTSTPVGLFFLVMQEHTHKPFHLVANWHQYEASGMDDLKDSRSRSASIIWYFPYCLINSISSDNGFQNTYTSFLPMQQNSNPLKVNFSYCIWQQSSVLIILMAQESELMQTHNVILLKSLPYSSVTQRQGGLPKWIVHSRYLRNKPLT